MHVIHMHIPHTNSGSGLIGRKHPERLPVVTGNIQEAVFLKLSVNVTVRICSAEAKLQQEDKGEAVVEGAIFLQACLNLGYGNGLRN